MEEEVDLSVERLSVELLNGRAVLADVLLLTAPNMTRGDGRLGVDALGVELLTEPSSGGGGGRR